MKIDNLGAVLIKALGVPGHDTELGITFGFACADDFAFGCKCVTYVDVLNEFALLNALERTATFAEVLYRHTEYRVEH